jgi:hypothetical protein
MSSVSNVLNIDFLGQLLFQFFDRREEVALLLNTGDDFIGAEFHFGAGNTIRFTSPRRRLQRILVPSGDHRGFVNSPTAVSVSWRTPLPSRFITKS